jgi:Xaa-Pro aminopeptidase
MTEPIMMPSIALPTGPYDWHPEEMPLAVFEARLAGFREVMRAAGLTHAIVHGNGFDHGALAWLTHFTPKLGPAYALVPLSGALRLLFAGGPGMKPSAQCLTWVDDVAALKSIAADARRWLDETAAGQPIRLGLVEGAAMLYGDWQAVNGAVDTAVVALDGEIEGLRAAISHEDHAGAQKAAAILAQARTGLVRLAVPGADLRTAVIEMERAAYAAGAQDVRVRIVRRPGGRPVTLPDAPLPLSGPSEVVLRVRYAGQHAAAVFFVGM